MIEQLTRFLKDELYGTISLSSGNKDKYRGHFEIRITIEEGYFELQFRHSKYEKEYFTKDEVSYLPITEENIQEAASFVTNIINEKYLNKYYLN